MRNKCRPYEGSTGKKRLPDFEDTELPDAKRLRIGSAGAEHDESKVDTSVVYSVQNREANHIRPQPLSTHVPSQVSPSVGKSPHSGRGSHEDKQTQSISTVSQERTHHVKSTYITEKKGGAPTARPSHRKEDRAIHHGCSKSNAQATNSQRQGMAEDTDPLRACTQMKQYTCALCANLSGMSAWKYTVHLTRVHAPKIFYCVNCKPGGCLQSLPALTPVKTIISQRRARKIFVVNASTRQPNSSVKKRKVRT